MGLSGKIKMEKLKETVVKGYEKDIEIVITQFKKSYKGVNIYTVCSELKYAGKLFDIIEFNITFNKKKSERYFSMLESRYQEERLKKKFF